MVVVYEDDDLRWAITQVLRYESYEVLAYDSPQSFLDARQPGCPTCVVFGLPSKELVDKDPRELILQLSAGSALVVIGGETRYAESLRKKSGGRFQVLGPPLTEETLLVAVHAACRSIH